MYVCVRVCVCVCARIVWDLIYVCVRASVYVCVSVLCVCQYVRLSMFLSLFLPLFSKIVIHIVSTSVNMYAYDVLFACFSCVYVCNIMIYACMCVHSLTPVLVFHTDIHALRLICVLLAIPD